MVSRRASNTNTADAEEEGDVHETCKKIKSLQDTVSKRHRRHQIHDQEEDDQTQHREDDDEEEEEQGEEEAVKPIGEVIRVSDEGGELKMHYSAFQFDGSFFHLEDPVLVTPEEDKIKPSVAIIKDIFQTKGGELMVSGQRFYRPEEAEKERGGTWQRHDPRELFYSNNFDNLPAETVMHRCVIHLVPLPKALPNRKQHPGFVIRKFYDYERRRLRDLTDRDCGCSTRRGIVESV